MKIPGITDVFRHLACGVGDILAPDICIVCGRPLSAAERFICLDCDMAMPRLSVHISGTHNRVSEHLMRLTPEPRLASMFRYSRHNPYSTLIHAMKYKDMPGIGNFLGEKFAAEIQASGFFAGIDALVPVPIHWRRRFSRGYNQSTQIARGVSDATGIPVIEALQATTPHVSQTRRSGAERLANVSADHFRVRNPDALAGKEILLIDDIITTGTTVESCVLALRRDAPSIAAIHILSLGLTENF